MITGLGGSTATPPEGITAEVVRYTSLEALDAAPAAAVQGRIVFLDEHTTRTTQTPRRERASDVALPLGIRKIDLARCIAQPPEASKPCTNPERLREGVGKQRSLVVPAGATPPPVQGNRDYRVDPPSPMTCPFGHHRAQHRA